jgi:hypothetical protein
MKSDRPTLGHNRNRARTCGRRSASCPPLPGVRHVHPCPRRLPIEALYSKAEDLISYTTTSKGSALIARTSTSEAEQEFLGPDLARQRRH